LIETTNGIVHGATYRWRPDYSDADRVTNSATENITITTATGSRIQPWYYPNSTDCVTCHTPQSGGVLGASTARQLNGDFLYPGSGEMDNQLRTLNSVGLFNPAIDETAIEGYAHLARAEDTTASLHLRARSFLDVNCAYCHQPGGVRANFDARFSTPLSSANILNGSVIADLGVTGTHVVTVGDPLRSAAYQRVLSTAALVKMPPLARNEVDVAAADMLAAGITSLVGAPPTLAAVYMNKWVVFTWTVDSTATNGGDFYLELANSIDAGAVWTLAPAPTINGNQRTVTVTVGGSQLYGRLTSSPTQ
jgi:mono/diheme cytochrome c family protein